MSQPCTCATPSHRVRYGPCGASGHKGCVIWLPPTNDSFSSAQLGMIGKDFMMTTVEQLNLRLDTWAVLGIETSCDETAASVLAEDGTVLSNIITSQHAVHQRFGGVVPELASRAHIESIEGVSRRHCNRPVSHGGTLLESP